MPLNNILLRSFQVNNPNGYTLINVKSISVNWNATEDKHVVTKAYVDYFGGENERWQRSTGLGFYNTTKFTGDPNVFWDDQIVKKQARQGPKDFSKQNMDSVPVNYNLTLKTEKSGKKFEDKARVKAQTQLTLVWAVIQWRMTI